MNKRRHANKKEFETYCESQKNLNRYSSPKETKKKGKRVEEASNILIYMWNRPNLYNSLVKFIKNWGAVDEQIIVHNMEWFGK